jgi:hypothetical protein
MGTTARIPHPSRRNTVKTEAITTEGILQWPAGNAMAVCGEGAGSGGVDY